MDQGVLLEARDHEGEGVGDRRGVPGLEGREAPERGAHRGRADVHGDAELLVGLGRASDAEQLVTGDQPLDDGVVGGAEHAALGTRDQERADVLLREQVLELLPRAPERLQRDIVRSLAWQGNDRALPALKQLLARTSEPKLREVIEAAIRYLE